MGKHRTLRVPDELDARLVAQAELEERPVSWLIVKALESCLGGSGLPGRLTEAEKASMASQGREREALSRLVTRPTVLDLAEDVRPEAVVRRQVPAASRKHMANCKCPMCKPAKGA